MATDYNYRPNAPTGTTGTTKKTPWWEKLSTPKTPTTEVDSLSKGFSPYTTGGESAYQLPNVPTSSDLNGGVYGPQNNYGKNTGPVAQKDTSSIGPTNPTGTSTPTGFSYAGYGGASDSPSTVNTADLTPDTSAYTSTNEDVLKRIREMQNQTVTSSGSSTPTNDSLLKVASNGLADQGFTGPDYQSQLDAMRQSYLGTFGATEKEKALQDQLTAFQENYNLGYAGLEGQGRGIPLELVKGQQAQLQTQGAIKEASLLNQLKLEQDNRKLLQDRAEAELGFLSDDIEAQKVAEQAKAEGLAPIEINGNLVALNPATGQYEVIYQSPLDNITLKEGETIIDPNTGTVIASMPKNQPPITVSAGQTLYDPVFGTVLFTAPNKPEALPSGIQEYLFAQGQGYTGDYNSFKNQTGEGGTGGDTQQMITATYNSAMDKISLIDSLISSDALGNAVGPFAMQRLQLNPFEKGKEQEFVGGVNQLISQETIDALTALKAKGGTLGALSDQERIMLQNSATKIGTWAIKDELGMPTGKFAVSEEAFIAELNKIKGSTQRIIDAINAEGNAPTPVFNQQDYQSLIDAGYSQEEAQQFFSNDPSKSVNGSTEAGNALDYNYSEGSYGGQCGRFVNRIAGTSMGDTYQSKMNLTDPELGKTKPVQAGDFFVMPYSTYGHTGFVANGAWIPKADGTYDIPVIDSNFYNKSKPETVSKHYINSSLMSGFGRANVKTQKVSFA